LKGFPSLGVRLQTKVALLTLLDLHLLATKEEVLSKTRIPPAALPGLPILDLSPGFEKEK
jgi:hypothetical protein